MEKKKSGRLWIGLVVLLAVTAATKLPPRKEQPTGEQFNFDSLIEQTRERGAVVEDRVVEQPDGTKMRRVRIREAEDGKPAFTFQLME